MSLRNLPEDLPRLPPRNQHSHKGTYGRCLLIGGSLGMAGSIALSGRACLKGGAGLVTLAVPDCVASVVATHDPAYMTLPLYSDRNGQIPFHAKQSLLDQISQYTALAFGPGLGKSTGLRLLAESLFEDVPQPLVCDADGLNLLACRSQPLARAGGPRILTPHLGEFRRLIKDESISMETARKVAPKVAQQFGVVVVLKGAQSLVTDGTSSYVNPTGNPGLATGGTGDVLTGLITALCAQQLTPFDAAKLGVYLHGLAADLGAAETSQPALTATDLLDFIENAWVVYQEFAND